MDKAHSRLGITSFIIAAIAALLILGTFMAAAILQQGHPPGDYPGKEMVGFVMILLLFVDVIALILGAISVFDKERKRLFGVLGLCISGVAIFGTMMLFVIGVVIMLLKR